MEVNYVLEKKMNHFTNTQAIGSKNLHYSRTMDGLNSVSKLTR